MNLPNDPTKDQELNHLEAFIDSLPKDCYLASLFTPDFTGYITQAIRDDGMPTLDVYAAYRETETELSNLKAMYNHDMTHISDKLKAAHENLARKDQQLADAVKAGLDRMNMQSSCIAEQHGRISELLDTNEKLERLVMHLKVKLYDLQNPE